MLMTAFHRALERRHYAAGFIYSRQARLNLDRLQLPLKRPCLTP